MPKRPLPPIGFWSYARPDDELSGGQLSRLRALIRAELQQQYGREQIQLFQDISAISHGSRWENEIRRALENSTFFIPILSPNFLQSEWCVQEVEIFQERQERLFNEYPDMPRTSRIFPVHYIDVQGIDSLRPTLDQSLRELQWFDFRDFRHQNFDSVEVRKTVSSFVSSLRDLLRVQVEQPDTPSRAASAPPPRVTTTAAPAASAAADPAGSAITVGALPEAPPIVPPAPTYEDYSGASGGDGGGGGSKKVALIAGGIVALLAIPALLYFLVLRRGSDAQPVAGNASANAQSADGNAAAAPEQTLEEAEAELKQAMLGKWGENAGCSGRTWDLQENGAYVDEKPGYWSISADRVRIDNEDGSFLGTVSWLDEDQQTVRLTPQEGGPETWFRCAAEGTEDAAAAPAGNEAVEAAPDGAAPAQ